MKRLVLVVLAACGSKAAPDAPIVIDDPIVIDAPSFDGTYTCVTQMRSGGSCDQPLFDDTIQAQWTLAIAGTSLTITTIGFDQPTIGCAGGTWTGGVFACTGSWSRAGRSCQLGVHLELKSPGVFDFWVGTLPQQRATCTKT